MRFALVANGIGLLLIIVAADGSRGADALADQIGWLNLAVVGLVVAAAADGGLLLFARRAVGRRRLVVAPDVVFTPSDATHRTNGSWVWVPGTSRAHHTDCPLAQGKRTETVDAARIRAQALRRCEICG
jgi:hypothetical protein